MARMMGCQRLLSLLAITLTLSALPRLSEAQQVKVVMSGPRGDSASMADLNKSDEIVGMATTVRMPVATTTPAPPVNTYTVEDARRNFTCISLQSGITLAIDYLLKGPKKEMKRVVFAIPRTAIAKGKCHGLYDMQKLEIKFFNGWSLSLDFAKSPMPVDHSRLSSDRRVKNGAGSAYGINQITLAYVFDEKRFPGNAFSPGWIKTAVGDMPDFPQIPVGYDFFGCSNATEYKLGAHVQVVMERLRFKAYNRDNNAGFSGREAVCGVDYSSGKGLSPGAIAGIAVACVAVVVLVTLAVVMVLRRKRASYQDI